MKAVVGLGNPGEQYVRTRHNLGFRVAELVAERHGAGAFRRQGASVATRVVIEGQDVLVVKPMTYMNLSGAAVREICRRHGVRGDDLIVAHDDLDLEPGDVRIKIGGGHGGHNGLRSILAEADAGEFVRVRLGIRRPDPRYDAADWVLARIPREQSEAIDEQVGRGASAVEAILGLGPRRAMNEFNRRESSAEASSNS